MQTRRWTNPTHPQTLQIAVFLLYINAVFEVLAFLRSTWAFYLAAALGGVAAGYGIANERKWGYGLGLAVALLPFILRVYLFGLGNVLSTEPLGLIFEVALVALLVHPQSRDYQRIWFK
jgi:hypothetical protein